MALEKNAPLCFHHPCRMKRLGKVSRALVILGVTVLLGGCSTGGTAISRYKFTVVNGVLPEDVATNILSNDPGFIKANKVILCKTVILNKPFRFDDPTNFTTASGILSRGVKGTLHFEGEVRVISATTSYDTDVELGKGYKPAGYGFSGGVSPFFVRFEQ